MGHTMHIDEIKGNLFQHLCNALEHKVTITSEANPLAGHGFIGKTPIPIHGIQNDSLNVVCLVIPNSTFSRVDRIGMCFQFFITFAWILIHY
jgi:hypothetical protein